MAERRMFTKKITDDDHFMSLSSSAQALYLHLSMSADDDGFNNQISACMFKAHASVSDIEALLSNRYIYQFDNGVIVIKHWRMANALRKDRYNPTTFKKELSMLSLDENGAYTMSKTDKSSDWLPDGCQMVAEWLPQDSIGKDSIGKDSIDKKEKPVRHKYGEYANVLLSDDELGKWKAECPADWSHYIESLSEYIASTGKSYKNFLATLRNWYRRDTEKNAKPQSKPQKQIESSASYDIGDYTEQAIKKKLIYERK